MRAIQALLRRSPLFQNATSTFPEFRKHRSDGPTLFRTALLLPSRDSQSFACSVRRVHPFTYGMEPVDICLPKTYTVLRPPRAGKLQQIELSSDFVGHSWPALATSPALAFQAEPELFVRIKLSHKLLNTSLLWRNVVFKVHDRMRLCHGPPPAVFQHRSGGDDRTKTRHRPFLSQSHSFSMACREDNRPGGSSDVYACDVPWVKILCLSLSRRRRLLAFLAKLLRP